MNKANSILKNNEKKNSLVYMAKKLRLYCKELESHQGNGWNSPFPEFIRILYQRRFGANKE